MPSILDSIDLDLIANWSSIISLGISGTTLFVTSRIKASVLKQVEKTDYMHDIDTQLTDLQATYETLVDKESPITEQSLDLALGKLEIFPIQYGNILPKKVMKQVASVTNYFNVDFRANIEDSRYRRTAASELNKLIHTLEKEKKIL